MLKLKFLQFTIYILFDLKCKKYESFIIKTNILLFFFFFSFHVWTLYYVWKLSIIGLRDSCSASSTRSLIRAHRAENSPRFSEGEKNYVLSAFYRIFQPDECNIAIVVIEILLWSLLPFRYLAKNFLGALAS